MMRHRNLPSAISTATRLIWWLGQITRELATLSVYHPAVLESAEMFHRDAETLAFWLSERPPLNHRESQ
jgi:hypothetical protein